MHPGAGVRFSKTFIAIAGSLLAGALNAQAPTGAEPRSPSLPRLEQPVIDGLLEQSYITAPGAIIGDMPRLLFEANLAPPFYITAGNRLLIVGTPKVVLRMLRERSLPVRTPSYMPRVSAFLRVFSNQFLTATISHHSNGQDDETLLPNGDLNVRTGNFSTSFIEGGIQGAFRSTAPGRLLGYRASVEYHPARWTNEDIRALYPPRRIRLGLDEIMPLGGAKNGMLGEELQVTVDLTWYLGGEVPSARFGPDRMGGWYTLSFRPAWLRELTLFLNAYVGPDYYNIHFLERLHVLRVGLGTRRSSQPSGPVLRTPS
jgi:hypothetical protein